MSNITYIGGATAAAGSATTNSVTYSPTAGNFLVGYIAFGNGTISNLKIVDNNGNPLIPMVQNSEMFVETTGGTTGYIAGFWGVAVTGATSYTVTWTTSAESTIVLAEYSNVVSAYWYPSTSTLIATGDTTTATISVSTLDPDDVIVAGVMNNASEGYTAIAGTNLRQTSSTAETCPSALMDSGVVSAVNTSQTVKCTVNATEYWVMLAFILRPFAGGPYNSSTNPSGATGAPVENYNVPETGLPSGVSCSGIPPYTGATLGNYIPPWGQLYPRTGGA